MANKRNLMDIVSTPLGDFAMVETLVTEPGAMCSNMSPETRHAEPLFRPSPDFIPHLYSIAEKYPGLPIDEIKCVFCCMALKADKLGRLVDSKTVDRYASIMAAKQQSLLEMRCSQEEKESTPQEIKECVKNTFLFEIWRQLIKGEAENFFPIGYDAVGRIKYANDEIRIAQPSMWQPSVSPPTFSVYDAPTVSEWNGLVYPVRTLVLDLKEKLECRHPEQFRDRF